MIDDNLGSPDEVLDDSGNVVDKIKRNSVGQTAYESNPSTVHSAGFAGGHLSAATALVQNGVRWLDPATGRWLSQDPSGFGGQDPNLSRYAGNDVTNRIDPSGLFATGYQAFAQGGTTYSQFSIYSDSGGTINQATMPMGATSSLNMVFNSMAMSGTGSGPSSWLDSYAKTFNAYMPGGQAYTTAAGNWLNTHASWVAPADASDWGLAAKTTAAAIPAALGMLYGAEALLVYGGVLASGGTFYGGTNALIYSTVLYAQAQLYAATTAAAMLWKQMNAWSPGAQSPAIGPLQMTKTVATSGYQILNTPSWNRWMNYQWIQNLASTGQPIFLAGPLSGKYSMMELEVALANGYQLYWPWLIKNDDADTLMMTSKKMDMLDFKSSMQHALNALAGRQYSFVRPNIRDLQFLPSDELSKRLRASREARQANASLPKGTDIDLQIEALCRLYLGGSSRQRFMLRRLVVLDLFHELLHFTTRMANDALRDGGGEAIVLGLTALSIEDVRLDVRESLSNLALLFSAATDSRIEPEPLFNAAASMSGRNMMALVENFLASPPESRSPDVFFFRVAQGPYGREFRWEPPGLLQR